MQAVLATVLSLALQYAPEVVMTVFTVVLLPLIVGWVRALKSKEHQALLEQGVEVAYFVVEQISRKTATPLDDKAAEALKILRDSLKLVKTPADETKARLLLAALHEKVRG